MQRRVTVLPDVLVLPLPALTSLLLGRLCWGEVVRSRVDRRVQIQVDGGEVGLVAPTELTLVEDGGELKCTVSKVG